MLAASVNWGAVVPIVISLVALVASLAANVVPYARRPRLSLEEDTDREHSRVEGDGVPYVRLLVTNARGKRSAAHARVVLDGCRRVGQRTWTRFGCPFMAWPSVFGQDSDAYVDVIFAGSSRPVALGRLIRIAEPPDPPQQFRAAPGPGTAIPIPIEEYLDEAPRRGPERWWLKLELPNDFVLTDERDLLEAGNWTVRLIVGADDGDARTYEVDIAWKATYPTATAALDDLLSHLAVRKVHSR